MIKAIRKFNIRLPFFTSILIKSFHPFVILMLTHLFINHRSKSFLLPLIFYYSIKSSVLFIFRSNPVQVTKLFKYSVFIGIIGCLMAFISNESIFIYSIAGILMGICSGIVIPSYATLKRTSLPQSINSPSLKWKIGGILCSILYLISLAKLIQLNSAIVFIVLGIALIWLYQHQSENLVFDVKNKNDYPEYAIFESLFLFIVIFASVFVLKEDKKEGITNLLPGLICTIFIIMIFYSIYRYKKHPERRISFKLSSVIIYKGMLTNFILAFLTFYQVIKNGESELMAIYYIYLVGMLVKGAFISFLKKIFYSISEQQLIMTGLLLSFIFLLFQPTFYVGILCLSLFVSELNSELDQYVYNHVDLPKDFRLIAKARLTNIGSVINQLIMFTTLYIAALYTNTTVLNVLKAYHSQKESLDFLSVLNVTKNSMLVVFVIYLYGLQKILRKVTTTNNE